MYLHGPANRSTYYALNYGPERVLASKLVMRSTGRRFYRAHKAVVNGAASAPDAELIRLCEQHSLRTLRKD